MLDTFLVFLLRPPCSFHGDASCTPKALGLGTPNPWGTAFEGFGRTSPLGLLFFFEIPDPGIRLIQDVTINVQLSDVLAEKLADFLCRRTSLPFYRAGSRRPRRSPRRSGSGRPPARRRHCKLAKSSPQARHLGAKRARPANSVLAPQSGTKSLESRRRQRRRGAGGRRLAHQPCVGAPQPPQT